MSLPEWLPALEDLTDYGGDFSRYLEAIYQIFCADFVESKPMFEGKRLGLKRHPIIQGKEATFWHMISEGNDEAERLPDLRRCERIRWPRPIIENASDTALKVWREPNGSGHRVLIWFSEAEYLVVLDERKDYILPWTAYPVEREHQQKKLERRWERHSGGN
ncbi:hypothetical protein AAIH29_02590 [Pseudomonas aeruginosa]|uniref:hypothetical protein n=1 Tax=Pseudomonas aeruginosa TaxID=287 RepID=UPI000D65BD61|nr:hypothetical protein [Pseudomonas aeruginosa]MBG4243730.1 hypothetical protein [Pseudomonas aeruginosa]MBX5648241.1 hypothetical protein [Pseudomonas aeruginosa]MCG0479143.1 hypothetical protein [Pseudomonas aeruginosa]MCO3750931.1 hypothetical protein [Pseudomonas aeruginosa]MCY0414798.1 hypothetical protein [Pseudomonas aeruginosa]